MRKLLIKMEAQNDFELLFFGAIIAIICNNTLYMETGDLIIRKLNKREVIEVYCRHLRKDFPRNERRPLAIVLKGKKENYYECLGCFKETKLVGYLFLVKHNADYLIDYFAVVKRYRGIGIGSAFIKTLPEHIRGAESIILEVENPDFTKTSDERAVCIKRIAFYTRNGYVDTKVKTNTFGVNFIILQNSRLMRETNEVKLLYAECYKQSLPESLYRNNIKVY